MESNLTRSGVPCLPLSPAERKRARAERQQAIHTARLEEARQTYVPRALISMCTAREYHLISTLIGYRWFQDSEIKPHIRKLADEMGCAPRTVQYALRGLEAKGLIVREARYRADSDHGQTSNVFHPGPMLVSLLAPLPEQASTGGSAWVRPPVQGAAHRRNTPERYNRRNTRERHSPIPTASSAYYETRSGTLRPR